MANKVPALKTETSAACDAVKVDGKLFFKLPLEKRNYDRETACSIIAHLAKHFFAGTDEQRLAFFKHLVDESNITESSNFKKRLVALEMLPAGEEEKLSKYE